MQASSALVLCWGEQVALREVDGDVAGDGILAGRVLGPGHELAVGAEQQVQDDLEVGRHVVRLGEDEDGVELEVREVARLGLSLVFLGEVAAQRDGRVPGQNVLGVDDVLEAVALCDLADVEALATAHQHVLVVLGQGLHGSVRLDELVGRDGVAQDLCELCAASFFGLATAVGEEDIGELDAWLVSIQFYRVLSSFIGF